MTESFFHRTRCASCGSSDFAEVLDLGEMPLANAFIGRYEINSQETVFPLKVLFCRGCFLVQLADAVDPSLLFKNYDYLTSASRPLADHFVNMAYKLTEQFVSSPQDLIVEIGSNDGIFLLAIKDRCRVLGVDPAQNIKPIAERNGIPTITDFFTRKVAEKVVLEHGKARLVVANNVMAHIRDVKNTLHGVSEILDENGVFVFEVHWLGNLIHEGGFDQIYHEHLYYYSLHALQKLLDDIDLSVFDVALVPIHGESMRVSVSKTRAPDERVRDFLEAEKKLGLTHEKTFSHFFEKIQNNKRILMSLLGDIKGQKKRVVGYGAPAKGNTLLNYFGITTDLVEYIVDSTVLKQGLFSPGAHIPIRAPEEMRENPPDYFLLLAWNYKDAILEKEKALRQRGVKFIIPVPEVSVI